jgi:Tfp pilus assembly protein PilP
MDAGTKRGAQGALFQSTIKINRRCRIMKKIFILFATLLVSQVVIAGNVFCEDDQFQWISDFDQTRRVVPPVYNSVGKLDPFQPIFGHEPIKQAPKVHQTDCISNPVLEGVDMSQLKLTGIAFSGSRQIALFQEANNKGHIITKGMCFGRHGGNVERVLKDRIIVRQEMKDATGQIQVKKIELKLKRKIN